MSVELIPKRNWLTLRRKPLNRTDGGIIIPGEKGYRYVVERVSSDVEMEVEVGQEVFTITPAIAAEVVVGGDPDVFLIKECDIVALIQRDSS